MRIPIDKNIALPPAARGPRGGPKRRWPFRRMEKGDSFLLLTDSPERLSRLAYSAAKRVGVRIAIRQQEGGIRIWRMAEPEKPRVR